MLIFIPFHFFRIIFTFQCPLSTTLTIIAQDSERLLTVLNISPKGYWCSRQYKLLIEYNFNFIGSLGRLTSNNRNPARTVFVNVFRQKIYNEEAVYAEYRVFN